MRHSALDTGDRLFQPSFADLALQALKEHAATALARCRAAAVGLVRRGVSSRRSEDSYFEIWLAMKHRHPRHVSARAWRRHSGYLVHRAVAYEQHRREREPEMARVSPALATVACPRQVASCEPAGCADQRCIFAMREIRGVPAWSTAAADMGPLDGEFSSLARAH
jgi:hypothetical protein